MSENADPLLTLVYRDTRWLSRLAAAAFVLMAAVCWTVAGFDVAEMRSLASGVPDPERTLAHQKAGTLLRIAQLSCAMLLAAAFLPWLYRVRANLRAFGLRQLRFAREWTYLGFLVPGINAYRPLQIMSEVWCGSVARSADPVAWRSLATPGLVTTWWLCFVSWIMVGAWAASLLALATSVGARTLGHGFALTADVCAALSASLGYLVVTGIQRAQWERSAHREAGDVRDDLLGGQLVA